MNVLLVEDDPALARGIQVILEIEGYRTFWASNLKSAYEINEGEKLGLVILDLGLADGSGFDFLTKVRESLEPCAKFRPFVVKVAAGVGYATLSFWRTSKQWRRTA
ncbi:MAG: response regulator [Bdellovibrionales bacterium]|nr:response regulator [Bdellovibrionales bacterium]